MRRRGLFVHGAEFVKEGAGFGAGNIAAAKVGNVFAIIALGLLVVNTDVAGPHAVGVELPCQPTVIDRLAVARVLPGAVAISVEALDEIGAEYAVGFGERDSAIPATLISLWGEVIRI